MEFTLPWRTTWQIANSLLQRHSNKENGKQTNKQKQKQKQNKTKKTEKHYDLAYAYKKWRSSKSIQVRLACVSLIATFILYLSFSFVCLWWSDHFLRFMKQPYPLNSNSFLKLTKPAIEDIGNEIYLALTQEHRP